MSIDCEDTGGDSQAITIFKNGTGTLPFALRLMGILKHQGFFSFYLKLHQQAQ